MGAKQSRGEIPRAGTMQRAVDSNGQSVARAIAKGRVYVVIRFPRGLEADGGAHFDSEHFRELLAVLQEGMPDFEVTLDAGSHERFCQHAIFFNSSDKSKFEYKPRVLVEVFYTGWTAVDKDMVRRTVTTILDPVGACHFDVRIEMGRYHTTPHLETLLRV